MHVKSLKSIKAKLIRRREELERDIDRLEAGIRTPDDWPAEQLEKAGKESSVLMLTTMDARESVELEAIHRALARIEAGTFGVCHRCGRAISTRRLKVLPETTLCRRCARHGGKLYERAAH